MGDDAVRSAQQRALPRPGTTDHEHELPVADCDVDGVERRARRVAIGVADIRVGQCSHAGAPTVRLSLRTRSAMSASTTGNASDANTATITRSTLGQRRGAYDDQCSVALRCAPSVAAATTGVMLAAIAARSARVIGRGR